MLTTEYDRLLRIHEDEGYQYCESAFSENRKLALCCWLDVTVRTRDYTYLFSDWKEVFEHFKGAILIWALQRGIDIKEPVKAEFHAN